MLATTVGRPARLEGVDLWPGARDPAGAQGVHHRRIVLLGQERLIDRDQKRSFSAPPGYGPCLISSKTVSSSTRKPWPPPTAIRMSPTRSSHVVTTRRSSV